MYIAKGIYLLLSSQAFAGGAFGPSSMAVPTFRTDDDIPHLKMRKCPM